MSQQVGLARAAKCQNDAAVLFGSKVILYRSTAVRLAVRNGARTHHVSTPSPVAMAGLEGDLSALGVEGARAAGNILASAKAEDFVNNVAVEQMWAIQAFKYAETHFKLIQSRNALTLRLTGIDDEIHEQYLTKFKDLKIDVIDADSIKTPEAKELWRPFCNHFEGKVHDFNFGTLLRLDVTKDYTDENTILVPRIQFLAIEIARNKAGLNSVHYNQPS